MSTTGGTRIRELIVTPIAFRDPPLLNSNGVHEPLALRIILQLVLEDGTVGAVHGEAMDSAACKFYVSLAKAPGMDGSYTIFGKITKGLDIAHAINKRPVVDDGDLSDRPREPAIIREVIIK